MFDHQAAWLNSSGNMNQGNMVIYAHNKRRMFGPLRWIKVGETIEISNQSKLVRYQVTQAFEGKATDISHVTEPINRLTLYTCSGPLDRNRFFVLAEAFEVGSRQ
jgi:LPXTG-site transpeptidase (sortase) family protein